MARGGFPTRSPWAYCCPPCIEEEAVHQVCTTLCVGEADLIGQMRPLPWSFLMYCTLACVVVYALSGT